ncbi:MAG TPA: cyclic nucleotide-binding domain-containing protein [Gemmatales bacterium]|nr:cyclic nucleotide-binding domain-containing protein [Gemmatales bacterium]
MSPAILSEFASHKFLHNLSEPLRMLLAAGVQPFQIKAGEYIGREGEVANGFFLVQSGRVSITANTPNRGEVEIQQLGAGEAVGWSWLVPPHKWEFNARAIDDVAGLRFDADWLRNTCEQNHALGYQFLKQLVQTLAERLKATRHQLSQTQD